MVSLVWWSVPLAVWLTVVVGEPGQTLSAATCGTAIYPNTLCSLPRATARETAATDADDCCGRCVAAAWCSSWSFQHVWTPATPCHLSSAGFTKTTPSLNNSCGTTRTPVPPGPAPSLYCKHAIPGVAPPPPPIPPAAIPTHGVFVVDMTPTGRRQTFEGVEVELQSDSIGSDNSGMPGGGTVVRDDDPSTTGVPHDLTPSERARFAEALRGVRTIRLALGLFLRGLGGEGNRSIVGRWPSQMAELKGLQDAAGIDGFAAEYWSPAPAWKNTQSYYSGTLASFNASFLEAFAASVVTDVRYLQANGLKVRWWGLQNEPDDGTPQNITTCPPAGTVTSWDRTTGHYVSAPPAPALSGKPNSYSKAKYGQCDYYHAFMATAKAVRLADPTIRIHAASGFGQVTGSPIAADPDGLPLVDGWTWHQGDEPSGCSFGNQTAMWSYGKPVFTNEMEWQPGNPLLGATRGTVAFTNTYLNSLAFKNSPTGVIAIHAAKPTTNVEADGYGWTVWRSTGTNATPARPSLLPNHFEFDYWVWPSVAPFIKTVPWNSVRRHVVEDIARMHQRVIAFETPEPSAANGPLHRDTPGGKLVVVLTNEAEPTGFNSSFTATVGTHDNQPRTWCGFSYIGDADGGGFNVSLGTVTNAPRFTTTLEPNSVQWWYEQ